MSLHSISSSFCSSISSNNKVIALESTLQQSLVNFRDLVSDMEQMHIESEKYKTQFIMQKEKCDSICCNSAEILKKTIEFKDQIIQSVGSALTKLNETKNFNILDEVFKILCGDTPTLPSLAVIKSEPNKPLISPKKEPMSMEASFRDESVSEIEGTPTGRTSPIIQSKKLKTALATSSDFRDKKKCPDHWSTSENKSIKLLFSTPSHSKSKPNSRLKQGRLNVVRVRQSNVVDLTSSPEYSCERSSQNDNDCKVQLIKKESSGNDDTVLPSPTSLPTSFTLFKSSKDSPVKFKKPPLSLKPKAEKVNKSENKLELQRIENQCVPMHIDKHENAEDSINLLNPKRLPNNFLKESPQKQEHGYNETTYCDTQASISLLHQVKKLDDLNRNGKQCSPVKQPLTENINITNTPNKDLEDSMSLLQEQKPTADAVNRVRKKIPEFVEVVYKEAAPRKKAEKRMLPGWSCKECKGFFGELYKDDPVMLAKKIDECSKHRGNHDPERPQTPTNFWNPKWEVPQDTEEFNRKNNVT